LLNYLFLLIQKSISRYTFQNSSELTKRYKPWRKQPVQETTHLHLESEISRLTCALATRNADIGKSIIVGLRCQLTLRDVAGIVIVSLERLLWVDPLAFCWAVEQIIPGYVMREIRRITTITLYKQLIHQGLQPGEDFSMDAKGSVLLSDRAKADLYT
jgi:hypothetical protein